jgi:hypothetical protein
VDRKDVNLLLQEAAAGLLEQRPKDLQEAIECLLRLPDIGDEIAGPLPRRNVDLASGRVSLAVRLKLPNEPATELCARFRSSLLAPQSS